METRRTSGVRLASFALLFFFITSNTALASEITECDRKVSSPYDHQRIAPAVPPETILVAEALAACRRAVKFAPESPRLNFLMGYVLYETKQLEEAIVFLNKSANKDYAAAHAVLGTIHFTANFPTDNLDRMAEMAPYAKLRKAFSHFKKGADLGNKESMLWVGVFFEKGLGGFEKDPLKAFHYIKMSADRGQARAQYKTGVMYFTGDGTQKNKDKGLEYIRRAAKSGLADAREFMFLNEMRNPN